jgi:hypothetical protein
MTPDPHRLAVAHEEAVRALEARAKLAGVTDPDHFAREFIDALRHQGWRPLAPVTALPPRPNVVHLPDPAEIAVLRARLREARATTEAKEQP